MPSDSGERRSVRGPPMPSPVPEAEQHLPCPRCDSTNTKFCYYNNYNLSQPRHFCKSCRRYWTQGGTLRDVPVGGGSRSKSHPQSNKRSRTSSSSSSSATSSIAASSAAPTSAISSINISGSEMPAPMPASELEGFGTFSSLLASSCPGFLALGDPVVNRAGLGVGLEGVGFGLGRGVWPMAGDVAESSSTTWQVGIGDGFNDGDCFTWPDLAISTPGNGCLP
ncbi:hypothetical protein AAC387_Pa02g3463 [Persea americana]